MFEQGQGLGGGYVTMRQLGALARAVAGLPPTARVAPVVQRLLSTSLMCRSGTVPEEEQLPAHAQVSLKAVQFILNNSSFYCCFLHVCNL